MRKVRVYQLARELKVSSEVVIELLQEAGASVTSHANAVDSSLAEQVRSRFTRTKGMQGQEGSARSRVTGEVRRAKAAAAKKKTRRAAELKTAEPEPVSIWSISTLPKAPDVGVAMLGSAAPPTPKAPPPARRVGPAIPAPKEHRTSAVPEPRGSSRWAPPRLDGTSTIDVKRTYRPEFPREIAGGRGGRPGPSDRRPVGRKGKRKKKRRQVDEREMLDSVRRTMASLEGSRTRRRKRVRSEDGTEIEEESAKIQINEFATVSELAATMEVKPNEVVVTCLRLGVVANINRRLDRETIEAVADEFGLEVEFVKEAGEDLIDEVEVAAEGIPEQPRPAIVTVMGHVDHGKTKLLDYIRKTDIISSESGGITQHIGAYQARLQDGRLVTFLDTPGHKAFTSMRARGADVTDIVILMVAADDRVNEQTIEAINHARAARKPIVVAINKCDLPTANPDKIKQQLAEQGLQVEEWGGDTVAVEISAKFGDNVDKLLEMILLVAEMQELRAQKDRLAKGTVIEAKRDPGKGIVGTVLIQSGTLRIGDAFICGAGYGKVRAMINERQERIESVGPSSPVEVLGWTGLPQVGDAFTGVKSDTVARVVAGERAQIAREKRMRLASHRFRLGELHTRLKEQERIDLQVIIKADVQGSVEVLRDSLEKLSDEQVCVLAIHTGVGRINESDVLLATASGAMIIGFHVRPEPKATQLAQDEGVEIRLYQVIYEAIEELEAAKTGLLKPKEEERVLGSAEAREIFHVSKVGTVAGCHVVAGTVTRQAKARLIRGENVIWSGNVNTLKRFKDDVKEVAAGFDCGITLDGHDDIQAGDLIEAYVVEVVAPEKRT